jgi:hypothetical protein
MVRFLWISYKLSEEVFELDKINFAPYLGGCLNAQVIRIVSLEFCCKESHNRRKIIVSFCEYRSRLVFQTLFMIIL